MAKQPVSPVPHKPQEDPAHRRYRVGYVPNGGRDNPSPSIYLGGRWLASCGFVTGQYVTVSAKPGQLVIRLAPGT